MVTVASARPLRRHQGRRVVIPIAIVVGLLAVIMLATGAMSSTRASPSAATGLDASAARLEQALTAVRMNAVAVLSDSTARGEQAALFADYEDAHADFVAQYRDVYGTSPAAEATAERSWEALKAEIAAIGEPGVTPVPGQLGALSDRVGDDVAALTAVVRERDTPWFAAALAGPDGVLAILQAFVVALAVAGAAALSVRRWRRLPV